MKVAIVLAACAAALVLACGAGTSASLNDYGDIDGNVVGVGFLQVDLATSGPNGASLSLANLAPGDRGRQTIWASNDSKSATNANLYLTLDDLANHPGPCDTSPSKATGEIESGISGCTVTADAIYGTPAQGNLSRVLSIQVAYYSDISNPGQCATVQNAEPHNVILAAAPGTPNASAAGAGGHGLRHQLTTADGTTPLQLAPGAGVCVGIAAYWPPDNNPPGRPSRDYPSDNAAQGDSLRIDVRFDLIQAA